MTDRTVQNIQKIAKTKELKRALDELRATGQLDNKNEIAGRRGRGFKTEPYNDSGNNQSTRTVNFNSTTSPFYGNENLQMPASAAQGSEDASDVINDEDGLFSGQDQDNGAGKKQLKELTGLEDCLTGDAFEVRFDGQYKPPDSWYSSESIIDPINPRWILGYYYQSSIDVPIGADIVTYLAYGATPDESIYNAIQHYNSNNTLGNTATLQTGPTSVSISIVNGVVIINYSGTYSICTSGGSCGGGNLITAGAIECTGGESGVGGAACALTEPPTTSDAELWPEDPDRPTYLSWNTETGKFEPSSKDPDIPTDYTNGQSELNLCTTEGEYVTITPTKDGGFAIYETQSKGGPLAVDGTIKKLSRNLTVEGLISEDELNYYLPD